MTEIKMSRYAYVTFQWYMIDELKLSGDELIAYAIINGFTAGNMGGMRDGDRFIGAWIGKSVEDTQKVISRLLMKGLVIKREKIDQDGVRYCEYEINEYAPTQEGLR